MPHTIIAFLIICTMGSSLSATTISSQKCGSWTNPGTWNLNRLPVPTDTIVISDFVDFDANFTSEEPGLLHVTKSGSMCGLYTYMGSFEFNGKVFAKRLIHYYGFSYTESSLNVLEGIKVQGSGSFRIAGGGTVCVGCSAICDSCTATLLPRSNPEPENEIPSCLMSFPNVLLLNGSEANRRFIPSCLPSLKSYELLIFNRWGKLVFSGNQNNDWWNGYDQTGAPLADGVYFYECKYLLISNNTRNNFRAIKGWVEIINAN